MLNILTLNRLQVSYADQKKQFSTSTATSRRYGYILEDLALEIPNIVGLQEQVFEIQNYVTLR
jgi:hypothetical protein